MFKLGMRRPTEEELRVMGLDLGYVQLKGVEGDWVCKFPSIVKKRSEVIVDDVDDSEGYLITGQGGSWNVGSKGSYDFKQERLTSDSDIPKLLAVLGLYNTETASSIIDLMVSGLPIDDFKIPGLRKDFEKRLQDTFNFGFGSSKKHIEVRKAIVMPQSAGAFYDYILCDDGNENMSTIDIASEDVLVLDPGGKSTDGCIMESAKFSQESFTIWQGVWKIHNELRKLIMKRYRYNMPPSKLDDVLRTGIANLGGKPEKVADLAKIAVETVFPELRDELSLYVPDFRRFSAVLLGGGGCSVLFDYMQDLTRIPTIKLPNPEYANANGYRKYGTLKLKEGLL